MSVLLHNLYVCVRIVHIQIEMLQTCECVCVVFFSLSRTPGCTFSSSPHLLQPTTGETTFNQDLEQDKS